MAPFWGAPTDQLRETGTLFSTHALSLDELVIALDGIVLNRSHWSGPDADSFRTHYSATVRPSVDALSSSLRERSALLADEADQQDQASAPDGIGAASISTAATAVIAASTGVLDALQTDGLMSSNALGYWDNRRDERSGRRGEGRKNTPRNDGDESYDPDEENPNAQYATPGPAATPKGENGLGEGVPGTDADSPEPPAWTPPADGAGEHNSEFAGLVDHSVHSLAREGADLKREDWPNAAEHLDHFLDNTGEDYDADVDDLIADQPAFAQKARYEVDTQVNFRDRYNWDGGKSTQIGPFTVTDESLAAMHRAGIAGEYNLLGESSSQHTEGSVP